MSHTLTALLWFMLFEKALAQKLARLLSLDANWNVSCKTIKCYWNGSFFFLLSFGSETRNKHILRNKIFSWKNGKCKNVSVDKFFSLLVRGLMTTLFFTRHTNTPIQYYIYFKRNIYCLFSCHSHFLFSWVFVHLCRLMRFSNSHFPT